MDSRLRGNDIMLKVRKKYFPFVPCEGSISIRRVFKEMKADLCLGCVSKPEGMISQPSPYNIMGIYQNSFGMSTRIDDWAEKTHSNKILFILSKGGTV
jgi:hypothetical protein